MGIIEGQRIEVTSLTKRFGAVVAVDDLSFAVDPGRVTGFLGPNGAGKTTTLRLLLGLLTPTAGRTTIGGLSYAQLRDPLRQVGAGLDGSSFHPGRTARNHLRWICSSAAIPAQRVDDVLALVALTEAADRRVGGYSLGMRQRLTLAGAMLGDPRMLILDEPANGLDPEGIAWLRGFLRHLAAEGRTVLVSSHVLSEVQQTVDDVVILARGRLVHTGPLASLAGEPGVVVRTPDIERVRGALEAAAMVTETRPDGALVVRSADPAQVGDVVHAAGARLHLLAPVDGNLESTFLRMVSDAEHRVETERQGTTQPATTTGVA